MAKTGPKPTVRWCLLRDNELLRQLLSSARQEKHMTYEDIAKETGEHPVAIKRYFHNQRGLTQYGVIKMAGTLGYQVGLDITALHQ